MQTMKRFRVALTFECDSAGRAEAIERQIVELVRQQASSIEIKVYEELPDIFGSDSPSDRIPAAMNCNDIFEPLPSVL